MKPPTNSERIVIIGTGESAAIAFDYFTNDSPYEVVAFSAELPYITDNVINDRPVIPLHEIATAYPPTCHRAFIAASMTGLNRLRRRLYDTVKSAGFECVSFVSSHTAVSNIAEIGENTFIQEHVSIQYNVRIGNNVIIGSGTSIGHSSVLEDDCFVSLDATVCGFSKIGRSSFLGAKSCVADGLSVAEDCVIGAGAVVLADTCPRRVYIGNPARATGSDSLETFRRALTRACTKAEQV